MDKPDKCKCQLMSVEQRPISLGGKIAGGGAALPVCAKGYMGLKPTVPANLITPLESEPSQPTPFCIPKCLGTVIIRFLFYGVLSYAKVRVESMVL